MLELPISNPRFNVLGDSITLRLTTEQTDGKYSVAEFATPGGGTAPHPRLG